MKIIIALLFISIYSISQGQIISTEAPSVSASAVTLTKNHFQLETSLGISKSGYQNEQYSIPSTLFRVGLSERFELRFVSGYTIYKSSFGTSSSFDPIQIGAKCQFIKNKESATKVALITHVHVPKYESKTFNSSGILAVSHSFKEKNTIGYNLGYDYGIRFTSSDNYIVQSVNYSLIYGYSIGNKIGLFAELYGNYYKNDFGILEGNNLSFDLGFTYQLRGHIQLDYVFGRGLNADFDFHSVGFNILLPHNKKSWR